MDRQADRRPVEIVAEGGVARLHLTLAVSDYDHVRDLVHGVVRPDGIVLTAFCLPVEEMFYRFTHFLEWDISEMSFAKYIALTSHGTAPMVAIPVFPSRVFRHSAIYVRTDRGIAAPKDLEGCTVGVPEWAQTAGIFARGVLAERYGVDLAAIRWIQAGMDQPGRDEKVDLRFPAGLRCESRPDNSLSDMLLAGEIDAAITARVPAAVASGAGRIARLFPDYRREEAKYYEETGIYPIMHVMALRRTIFEQYPWVAMNLFKAFEEAKQRSLARATDVAISRFPFPWSAAAINELGRSFGANLFPYGVDANRTTLEAFCRFAYDQGVAVRPMTPEELFPAEVCSRARV